MPHIRFAKEGWLFIIPAIIVTAAAILLTWWTAAIVFGLLTLFMFNFFRDPHRAGSERHVDVLSPADGTVVQIKDVPDGEIWPGLTKQVSIFMSVFNPGKKIAAFSEKSSTDNEQNLVVIDDGKGGMIAFKQIAGLLARRIVFDKSEGDGVVRGERVGMIKFGSRVDIFFPPSAVVKVNVREKVKVGLTVIGEIEERA